MGGDPFGLTRFVEAQDHRSTYERALGEIHAGRKKRHWMWFVFPQIAGLGTSPMSVQYAITGLDEARAYLDHAVLGTRLRECAGAVSRLDPPPEQVFGGIDAQKLHSSMTLFEQAAGNGTDGVFRAVLDKHFGGAADDATLRRIGG